MIELLKIYWKSYRKEVAIIVAAVIFIIKLLLPLEKANAYNFADALVNALVTIGLYALMTPVLLLMYQMYKAQQIQKNPGYKMETPELFTRDNMLSVFTVYSAVAFVLSLVLGDISLFKL